MNQGRTKKHVRLKEKSVLFPITLQNLVREHMSFPAKKLVVLGCHIYEVDVFKMLFHYFVRKYRSLFLFMYRVENFLKNKYYLQKSSWITECALVGRKRSVGHVLCRLLCRKTVSSDTQTTHKYSLWSDRRILNP